MKAHWPSYFESLATELSCQSDRVRQLIGSAHWLSDGHHKEYLLSGLLNRLLPTGVIASRGFVVHPNNHDLCSKEQDLLIIDTTTEAPLFRAAGTVIALPETVLATISVKSTLTPATVQDTVDNLNSVRHILIEAALACCRVWCGGYYFESAPAVINTPTRTYEYLENALASAAPFPPTTLSPPLMLPDTICSSSQFLFRVNHKPVGIAYNATILGFDCGRVSTAFFLAQLLDHVAAIRSQGRAGVIGALADCLSSTLAPASHEVARAKCGA